MLVCFVGSFAGVVVESIWCILRHGYLESRAGLVYGPFNLLYGVGALTLTLALYRFRNRGRWLSFLGGMLVGSVVEYICSWGQELILGSRSWDYSRMPFNLNGKISVCSIPVAYWGVLGVLWIKDIYPRMAKWILKLPNRFGKIATWCVAAFLVVNCAGFDGRSLPLSPSVSMMFLLPTASGRWCWWMNVSPTNEWNGSMPI